MSSLDAELEELGGDLTTALDELLLNAAVLDAGGRVRWQNQQSLDSSGDVVGAEFARLVGEEHLERYQEQLARVLSRGEPAEFTLHIRDAEGRLVPTEVSAAPIRGGGSVVGIFGLGRSLDDTSAAGRKALGSPASELTQRQHEVLRLLAEGRSTQEIASALSLSPTT